MTDTQLKETNNCRVALTIVMFHDTHRATTAEGKDTAHHYKRLDAEDTRTEEQL